MQYIFSTLFAWGSWILNNIIAPPCCAGCTVLLNTPATIFCNPCALHIKPIASHKLLITPNKYMPVYAIAAYQEPLKKLILAKNRTQVIASKQLGELMWQHLYLHCEDIDYIIPIPLHWIRYAQRGYNQAEEIAKVLSRYSKKPVAHLLIRNKKTKYQFTLPADQRHENLKDAIQLSPAINQNMYKGKRFLLIDDLMTTGATLQTASKALLKLNPASMKAIVGCRVI